ncbi:MAG: 50S ribosomal subunit protein L32 [Candidatus Westeberhardia cardiocondylae]|nr:50S ribosomal subunit protein L32 [Candidatus Westeberhardia cardiocondylae]
MAVQKSKSTRSKRGMRRSHNRILIPQLSIDKETGEIHLRHNITVSGFYRGKKIIL